MRPIAVLIALICLLGAGPVCGPNGEAAEHDAVRVHHVPLATVQINFG